MDTSSCQVSHVTTAYTVPGMIPVCCIHHHHPQQRITNTPTTAYRACCVRDRASSSHERDSSSTITIETTTGTPTPPSKPPQAHHTSTRAAPQQQHSSRDSSRGGGDLTSPATVYVPEFKSKGKRQKQDLPIHFKKTRSHNGRPLFLVQLFLEPQNYKIIAKNNRSKCFHNSRPIIGKVRNIYS